MDFTLTPEQTLMRDSVERFVAEHYAFEQRVERERSIAGWSRDHWASFAELGWLGLPIPEAHGGFGGTAVDTMILMEAFGGGLVAEPFVPTVVLAGGILETASAESGAAEMLAEVRRNGLARAMGDPLPGVNAFAAPVFDHAGHVALVITAMGPAGTFDPRWGSPIAKALQACAADVSKRLGFGTVQAT